MTDKLSEKLKNLPRSSGVYFHKNQRGEVIYVGKAAVLKNRVRQYFQNREAMDAKTLALVGEIADVDWTETESEIDALFLESEMIKRYKPKWNILLRDDKSPTYVRVNLRDDFPFVSFTRQPADDGAEYIGPFYSGGSVKQALRLLRKVFPYYTKSVPSLRAQRSNLDDQKTGLPRATSGTRNDSKLDRQIGLEPSAEVSSAEYKKSLRQLISYLKGNRVKVVAEIEKAMKRAAANQQFEQAGELRNKLYNLKELRRQSVFSRAEFIDASRDQGLRELQELLGLADVPRRIEGYDISHHGGQNNTGSMVVISNGVADKSQYRKFRLRSGGNDDYKQLREVMERRLKHLSGWGRPDVVMLDGGKGQLSAVADLLAAENIAYLGRVKSGDHTRNAAVSIVVPASLRAERSNPDDQTTGLLRLKPRNDRYKIIELPFDSHLAKLIARLDDEAHRFAISYHTHLKRKSMLK